MEGLEEGSFQAVIESEVVGKITLTAASTFAHRVCLAELLVLVLLKFGIVIHIDFDFRLITVIVSIILLQAHFSFDAGLLLYAWLGIRVLERASSISKFIALISEPTLLRDRRSRLWD